MAWRLMRRRYDLVIAVEEAAFMALALKPFFRVPYVWDIDSSIPEQINDKYGLPGWLHRGLIAAERQAARGSIGALPCCKSLGEIVRGHAPSLPVQTLEDVSLVAPEPPAAAPPRWDFDAPVLMYVGNLEHYQGVELLIEGFAQAAAAGVRAHLVIIGGTPGHIAAHRDLAERLGIAAMVTFAGPRPVEEIGHYMEQAAVVVSPRIQGRNTPMKVYSYLDSGRPLLATRLPTHTQVLDDTTAMLVDPTPQDMARGIAALLNDPALSARLAAAAAALVRAEFSPAAYRRKLAGFLEGEIIPRLRRRRAARTP
jgi:glycosyltransferase involved in cell wall biosynthesis